MLDSPRGSSAPASTAVSELIQPTPAEVVEEEIKVEDIPF
jgi:hypothetical protein